MNEALAALPDDEASTNAGQLALAVSVYALHEIYNGRPSDDDLAGLANRLAELESWSNVPADEVHTFLKATLDRARLDQVLPIEKVGALIYLVAGSLLSAGRREDEKWWDFLDRAEAAIEADQG